MLEVLCISLALTFPFLICIALVFASMLTHKGLGHDDDEG